MKEDILKIAVIGCSDNGDEVAKDIVGKLNLGGRSSVILIPHICAGSIYDYLLEKKERVYPILDNQVIEPQSIYVGMENPTNLDSSNFYGLRRELKIKEQNGDYIFSLGESEVEYINKAFIAVADAFKDKSIGVILNGMGGSGIEGTIKIKEAGGTTLVQEIDAGMHHVQVSMPFLVIHKGKADYVLPPDKLRVKLEGMLR